MAIPEKLRLDKYLWCIRLFKTRSNASEACEKGRVKWQGDSVKASRVVKVGDEFDIRTDTRRWLIKVTGLLYNRVAYTEAVLHYQDNTPPELLEKKDYDVQSFNTGKRLSKTGRPSKEQRRNREHLLDFDE